MLQKVLAKIDCRSDQPRFFMLYAFKSRRRLNHLDKRVGYGILRVGGVFQIGEAYPVYSFDMALINLRNLIVRTQQ